MYTQFFGLNEKPFAITPDPRYLFMSERHGEGLAHLLYGVTDSGGFIQLTGEVGTGKTTLVRSLLSQLPDEVDVALILNPQVTVVEFLQAICGELHIDMPAARDSSMALIDALNRFLLDAHARGRRIILLVDEAQNLSTAVLEQLRLLTNLETARQKLLQIILIGQPELREILAQNNLRQLAQRVTGRYHLEPLSREEAAYYIDHRMKVAGGLGEIFNDAAKREIYRLSGGIPRIMNVICDRALLGAYSQEVRVVDAATVQKAAREVSGEVSMRPGNGWLTALAAAAGVAGLAILVFALLQRPGQPSSFEAPAAPSAEARSLQPALSPVMTAGQNTASAATAAASEAPQPSLLRQLASGELGGSRQDAMRQLLALWSVDFDAAAGDVCAQAESHGLSCLSQRGSFGVLRQLNRPAVLTLTDDSGQTHAALLTRLDNETVELALGERRETFSLGEVSNAWLGQYLIIWRPPTGSPDSLRPGMRSAKVAWLRQSLAKLSGDDGDASLADRQYFDDALESRVRDFQRRNRLTVDGLAGQQTQIIINSMLADDGAPRLSGDI